MESLKLRPLFKFHVMALKSNTVSMITFNTEMDSVVSGCKCSVPCVHRAVYLIGLSPTISSHLSSSLLRMCRMQAITHPWSSLPTHYCMVTLVQVPQT